MTLKCFPLAIQNAVLLFRGGDQRAYNLFAQERSGNEITRGGGGGGRVFNLATGVLTRRFRLNRVSTTKL